MDDPILFFDCALIVFIIVLQLTVLIMYSADEEKERTLYSLTLSHCQSATFLSARLTLLERAIAKGRSGRPSVPLLSHAYAAECF